MDLFCKDTVDMPIFAAENRHFKIFLVNGYISWPFLMEGNLYWSLVSVLKVEVSSKNTLILKETISQNYTQFNNSK